MLPDSSALEILKRAEGLRREGAIASEAMTAIREEIAGNVKGEAEKPTGKEELLERLIEEKDTRIKVLEEEIEFLRRQVKELTPLALPRPRRWFAWLRPIRAGCVYTAKAVKAIHGALSGSIRLFRA